MRVEDAVFERLEDQIAWYGRKSVENQRWFKLPNGLQLATAAASRSPPRRIFTPASWPRSAVRSWTNPWAEPQSPDTGA